MGKLPRLANKTNLNLWTPLHIIQKIPPPRMQHLIRLELNFCVKPDKFLQSIECKKCQTETKPN